MSTLLCQFLIVHWKHKQLKPSFIALSVTYYYLVKKFEEARSIRPNAARLAPGVKLVFDYLLRTQDYSEKKMKEYLGKVSKAEGIYIKRFVKIEGNIGDVFQEQKNFDKEDRNMQM